MSEEVFPLASLEDELSTVDSYEWADRRTEDEHHYFEITAPSYGEMPLTAAVNVLEDGVEIFHETNIGHEPISNVIRQRYPLTSRDDVWTEYRSENGEEVLERLDYFVEDPRFDAEWQDISEHVGEDSSVSYGFRLTVHSNFGIPLEDHLEEVVQDFLSVMLRKDAPMESRRSVLRDTMVILDPDRTPEYYNVGVEFREKPEDMIERFDPGR